jgi:hypothetical protein
MLRTQIPVRCHLTPTIYAALLYISQMLPKINILRAPSFIFLRNTISEWPSSRSVLLQAQKLLLTLQSIMGISPITWLQIQLIKGLSFHTKSRANRLDEAEKDQSRELFCVRQQSYGRGGGDRKHLQTQINCSSFQITINYKEGCKNISRKACRICSFGRSSINM